jgi:hypothetical protein
MKKELWMLTKHDGLGIEEWMLIGEFTHVDEKQDRTIFWLEINKGEVESTVSIPNTRMFKFERK